MCRLALVLQIHMQPGLACTVPSLAKVNDDQDSYFCKIGSQ
jgi:hypothetical protein